MSDFITAKSLLTVVRSMMPNEVFVIQKLALATYKSKLPTAVDALNEACEILEGLGPATSTDTETLGLYGAVHKRLWDVTQDPPHLDKAIWAHEKGFYVKNDYYNGINLAFLLNVRAALKADTDPAEAIADFILAQRTRRRVLVVCERLLTIQTGAGGSRRILDQGQHGRSLCGPKRCSESARTTGGGPGCRTCQFHRSNLISGTTGGDRPDLPCPNG